MWWKARAACKPIPTLTFLVVAHVISLQRTCFFKALGTFLENCLMLPRPSDLHHHQCLERWFQKVFGYRMLYFDIN